MNSSTAKECDDARCPLCGQPNECQLCTVSVYKGACWCAQVKIPEELIAKIPSEKRNKACLCRNCVMNYHREKNRGLAAPKVLPGDFYFEGGLMVFTAAYHLRRGYRCGSDCRNCPYPVASTVAKSGQG